MLLATLPATPVQLAHACYRFGFHIVVPASWGDELVAHAVLEDLRERDRGPVIQCTCPLVSARLLANGQHLAPSMVQTASPPVAAARYARHALSPRQVRITYIGACPGAQHAAIDQRYMPDEFLRALDERDIAISDMPTVFDSVLPPDRRRFESLPGGCPTQEALWRTSDGRMLREVTQATFSTDLAQTLVWREYVMIDVAPSLGCACAGSYSRLGTRYGRVAVMALEPPRATEPVVTFQPEFVAATVEAPVEPEQLNGDAPPPPPEPPPQLPETRETEDEGRHASRVRVRTPSSAPLPRAYLAKRRHLATIAREPTPHVETLSETAFAEEPREAASEAVPPPNEERDVALPITVHVEPPLPPMEEPAAGPTTPATLPIGESGEPVAVPTPQAGELDTAASLSAPPSFVAPPTPPPTPSTETVETVVEPIVAVEEPPSTKSHAAEEARETAEEWELPTALATEEPADSFAPRAGPLRVEVEIYEETAAPEPEVVIPDAVLADEHLKPSSPAPEIVTRPVSHWGDLLIALWLVLVASAVIASLLWRR